MVCYTLHMYTSTSTGTSTDTYTGTYTYAHIHIYTHTRCTPAGRGPFPYPMRSNARTAGRRAVLWSNCAVLSQKQAEPMCILYSYMQPLGDMTSSSWTRKVCMIIAFVGSAKKRWAIIRRTFGVADSSRHLQCSWSVVESAMTSPQNTEALFPIFRRHSRFFMAFGTTSDSPPC